MMLPSRPNLEDLRRRIAEIQRRPRAVRLDAVGAPTEFGAVLTHRAPLRAPDLPNPIVLDLETTGLGRGAGTLAFLAGVGTFERGAIVVDQLVLASPARERPFLAALVDRIRDADPLVTFNGRCFDLPLLRNRLCMARLAPVAPPDVDVRWPARRAYRDAIPDGRLRTLEEFVLGRRRADDLPGRLAPVAFRTFLATGDARPLVRVADHNRADVIATAELCRLTVG
ncbi:MAG TPA: ribonuclease H-like domain-containing protein [Haliangiales bacterium]|nr:ribonuclease H-like domain-containing protein [Haliangiales bacterium]